MSTHRVDWLSEAQSRAVTKHRLLGIAFLATLMAAGAPASAAFVTYTAPMTGFTYDSDVQSAGFNAALGIGYTHIDFDGATNTDGTSYSSEVTFSTKVGIFGGSNTGSVNANSEIGPFGTWDGILNIDFLANGNSVSAVGFGLVEFNSDAEQIRIYDTSNNLVATFNNQLTNVGLFSMWGVAGDAGERIGRIELDGNFFAIQDIEFNLQAVGTVPEPSSLLLMALALGAGIGTLRRSKG